MGLGNIGRRYIDTRHNVGFLWIDYAFSFLTNKGYQHTDFKMQQKFDAEIAMFYNVTLNFKDFPNEVRDIQGKTTDILLVKPNTFMNLSGQAAFKLVNFYKIDVSKEFILIHDDLDFALGNFKIQFKKFPKAHNGVLSVQNSLGTDSFLRIRLGIDSRDYSNSILPASYVLQRMTEQEKSKLEEAILSTIKLAFS